MASLVLGVFDAQEDAEAAINTLESDGYRPKDMSIIMRDKQAGEEVASNTGANVAGGALTGATTGAAIGAVTGLLVGVGAIAIPGLGALLIGGPLAAAFGLTGAAATTVTGATTGAVAGGVLGALVGLGVPERDARIYEDRIREGAILLAVPAQLGDENNVMDTLEEYNATQVNVVQVPKDRYAQRADAAEASDVYADDETADRDFVINEPTYAAPTGFKGGRTRTTRGRTTRERRSRR